MSKEDGPRVCDEDPVSLEGQFWFGWAAELPNATVAALQGNGAFIIVSINTFHYPAHAKESLARQDVRRLLAAGVDGFQMTRPTGMRSAWGEGETERDVGLGTWYRSFASTRYGSG